MNNENSKNKTHLSTTKDFTRRGLSLLLIFSFVATIIGFTVAYCEHKNYKELLVKYDESLERISQCEVSIAALMTTQASYDYTTKAPEADLPAQAPESDKAEEQNDTSSDYQESTTPSASESEAVTTTVAETPSGYYVTLSGKKYHVASCSYLSKSKISISLERIRAEGYSPCSRCIK